MVNIIIKKGVYLALLACLPALQVQAEIYKCVNKQGKTFYNDKPCPVYDKETQMKAVKDPKNGYIPPAFVKDKEGKGKSTVIGVNTSKKLKKSVEEKDSPKDIQSNLMKSGSFNLAASASNVTLISDSGRVPSLSTEDNKAGKKASNSSKSATLPRVELKVEHREY